MDINKTFIIFLVLAVIVRELLAFLYSPKLKQGQMVNFITTLLSEPTSHGSFDIVTVQYSNGFSGIPLSLALPAENNLHYGQVVAISGKINVKVLKSGQPITTISSMYFKILKESRNFIFFESYFLRNKINLSMKNTFHQDIMRYFWE